MTNLIYNKSFLAMTGVMELIEAELHGVNADQFTDEISVRPASNKMEVGYSLYAWSATSIFPADDRVVFIFPAALDALESVRVMWATGEVSGSHPPRAENRGFHVAVYKSKKRAATEVAEYLTWRRRDLQGEMA